MADAAHTVAEAQRSGAVWVVVDGYRFAPDYIRSLNDSGLRVLLLDDDGRFDYYAANVVLNQNVSATAAMYANRAPFTIFIFSQPAVIRRPEPKLPGLLRGQEKMAGVCPRLLDDCPHSLLHHSNPGPTRTGVSSFPCIR